MHSKSGRGRALNKFDNWFITGDTEDCGVSVTLCHVSSHLDTIRVHRIDLVRSFKTTGEPFLQQQSRTMAKLLVEDEINPGVYSAVSIREKPTNEHISSQGDAQMNTEPEKQAIIKIIKGKRQIISAMTTATSIVRILWFIRSLRS